MTDTSPNPQALYRILVAEDSDVDARLLEAMLGAVAGEAFAFDRVRSMQDLDEYLASGRLRLPDALILDLGLPDSDGLATFQRASLALPGVAILILTATSDSGIALAAVAAGAQDYLVKGVADGEIIARAITFAIERANLDRRARAGEAALASHRRVMSVSQLAASAAHELQTALELALKSNLTVATEVSTLCDTFALSGGNLDMATRMSINVSSHAAQEALKNSIDALTLIQETARSLRHLGEVGTVSRSWVDLHRLIRRILLLNDTRWRSVAKVMTRLGFEVPPVACDTNSLERAMAALVENAIEAFEREGRRDGMVVITSSHDDHWVALRVEDNGPGIHPDLRPRLFEAFNSSKPIGTGGIGLTLARNAIEADGGTLTIEHLEPGTAAVIRLLRQ